MYADPGAAGGVLEPEGIVDIKYRAPDLLASMHRLDPVILHLKVGLHASQGGGTGAPHSLSISCAAKPTCFRATMQAGMLQVL